MKKSKGTIKLPTSSGDVEIEVSKIISIERNWTTTSFNMEDDIIITSNREFGHYLKLQEEYPFLCQINDDAIVNVKHVIGYDDGEGNRFSLLNS